MLMQQARLKVTGCIILDKLIFHYPVYSAGVIHFTESLSARQRWAMNHFLRTQLVSHLLDKLDLKRNDDVAKESHPSRIRKDHKQLLDISELLASCKNPFDVDCSDHLINLSTGKSASRETQTFLLNIKVKGGNAMNDFIMRCLRDPTEFEKPIKKQKIATFAEDGAVVKRTRV